MKNLLETAGVRKRLATDDPSDITIKNYIPFYDRENVDFVVDNVKEVSKSNKAHGKDTRESNENLMAIRLLHKLFNKDNPVIEDEDIIIPMPNHGGRAGYTLRILDKMQKWLENPPVDIKPTVMAKNTLNRREYSIEVDTSSIMQDIPKFKVLDCLSFAPREQLAQIHAHMEDTGKITQSDNTLVDKDALAEALADFPDCKNIWIFDNNTVFGTSMNTTVCTIIDALYELGGEEAVKRISVLPMPYAISPSASVYKDEKTGIYYVSRKAYNRQDDMPFIYLRDITSNYDLTYRRFVYSGIDSDVNSMLTKKTNKVHITKDVTSMVTAGLKDVVYIEQTPGNPQLFVSEKVISKHGVAASKDKCLGIFKRENASSGKAVKDVNDTNLVRAEKLADDFIKWSLDDKEQSYLDRDHYEQALEQYAAFHSDSYFINNIRMPKSIEKQRREEQLALEKSKIDDKIEKLKSKLLDSMYHVLANGGLSDDEAQDLAIESVRQNISSEEAGYIEYLKLCYCRDDGDKEVNLERAERTLKQILSPNYDVLNKKRLELRHKALSNAKRSKDFKELNSDDDLNSEENKKAKNEAYRSVIGPINAEKYSPGNELYKAISKKVEASMSGRLNAYIEDLRKNYSSRDKETSINKLINKLKNI